MNYCHVCGAALEGGRCNSCGFDASADFLAHPTLTGDARAMNEHYNRVNSAGKPEYYITQTEKYLEKAFSSLQAALGEDSKLSLEGVKEWMKKLEAALAAAEPCVEESAGARLTRAYNLYYGNGVTRDYTEAFRLFESVANDGYASARDRADANNMLGLCYEYGYGTAKDNKKAFEHYKLASDGGNLTAKNSLGRCYYYGKGTAVDYSTAKKLFESVANDGSAYASDRAYANNMLGMCYEYGYGTAKDNKKAFEHYKLACYGGNLTAKYNLGLCYYYGRGTAVDHSTAFMLFKSVATDGSASARDRADANNMLGLCHEFGNGTVMDKKKAVEHYRLASEGGSSTATNNLANCYYNGNGVTRDYAEAFRLFESVAGNRGASAKECARANNMLGLCHEFGRGTVVDKKKAVEYYRLASEGGNSTATNNLATCYYNGNGVTRDYAEALRLFESVAGNRGASAKECARANNMIGLSYDLGRGVAENKRKAVKYYKLASDGGNTTATNNLGRCYYNGWGVAVDYTTAFKLFERVSNNIGAPKSDRAEAKYMLGLCYYYGRGTARSRVLAQQMFESVVREESVRAETRELAQKMLKEF